MLVTSIFFFSHNVFKRFFPPRRQKSSLCGKGLKHLAHENLSLCQQKILDRSKFKAFVEDKINEIKKTENLLKEGKKTLWEKEKMLISAFFFSFSHNVLLRMTTPSSMAASRFKYNT